MLCASATLALGSTSTGAVAQERHYYVAEISGAWQAVSIGAPLDLAPLGRIPSTAKVRYTGNAADGASAYLILRDPRTLGKARLRCDATMQCAQPTAIAQVRFERSAAVPGRAVGALYATIGERENLRERLRLVGARSDDRALAVVVLPLASGRVDLVPLTRELDRPASGLVARFCALSGEAFDECLNSRRLLSSDCPLDGPCAAQRTPGAFRVDVFKKERTMLSTMAVASGFAVVVRRDQADIATAEHAALVAPLLKARSEFSDDEWRALLAAAALKIAGGQP
jgi:hypothetical protein